MRYSQIIVGTVLLLYGCVGVCAGEGAVERLLDVAPDNLVVYVATSGGEALKGDFEKSLVGKIWEDEGAQYFIKKLRKFIVNLIESEIGDSSEIKDPNGAEEVQTVLYASFVQTAHRGVKRDSD